MSVFRHRIKGALIDLGYKRRKASLSQGFPPKSVVVMSNRIFFYVPGVPFLSVLGIFDLN